jgi:hypothetical protein
MSNLDIYDKLVIEYRAAKTRSSKNKLYKDIRNIYYNKLQSIKAGFAERYHDYLDSAYDFFLLRAINEWTGRSKSGRFCHFSTYAYTWCVVKVKGDIVEKYVN